jgi:hypothetical protein
MGPTVCELEGPIPILKSSKRLVFTVCHSQIILVAYLFIKCDGVPQGVSRSCESLGEFSGDRFSSIQVVFI